MKTWIVKFTTDKRVVQEDIFEALDYTKAYLKVLYEQPRNVEIISVNQVCGCWDEKTGSCCMPDSTRKILCPIEGGLDPYDTAGEI